MESGDWRCRNGRLAVPTETATPPNEAVEAMPPHPQPKAKKPSESKGESHAVGRTGLKNVPLFPCSGPARIGRKGVVWRNHNLTAGRAISDATWVALHSGPMYGAHSARCWNPTEASNLQRLPKGYLLSATPCLPAYSFSHVVCAPYWHLCDSPPPPPRTTVMAHPFPSSIHNTNLFS